MEFASPRRGRPWFIFDFILLGYPTTAPSGATDSFGRIFSRGFHPELTKTAPPGRFMMANRGNNDVKVDRAISAQMAVLPTKVNAKSCYASGWDLSLSCLRRSMKFPLTLGVLISDEVIGWMNLQKAGFKLPKPTATKLFTNKFSPRMLRPTKALLNGPFL